MTASICAPRPRPGRVSRERMKLPRRPAAVIFDMDGLLFDTEALYQEAVAIAAVARGFDAGSGIFVRTIGLPNHHVRSLLLDRFGAAFPIDEFLTAWTAHF